MSFKINPSKPMQVVSCLPIVVICLTLLDGLLNATTPRTSTRRRPTTTTTSRTSSTTQKTTSTVPSHIGQPGRFYRAVYKEEMTMIGKAYKKGQSPSEHKKEAGDFAPKDTGGLYVFDVSSFFN